MLEPRRTIIEKYQPTHEDRTPEALFSLRYLYSLQSDEVRGEHSRRLEDLLVFLHESIRVLDLETRDRVIGLAEQDKNPRWEAFSRLAASYSLDQLLEMKVTAYNKAMDVIAQLSLASASRQRLMEVSPAEFPDE